VRALKDEQDYYPSKVLWPGIEKTDAYLRKIDFRAKKSLGQNFMVQEKVLTKIVTYADVQQGDVVLEIGSGTGNLTRYLLAKGAKVVCVEKDDRLFAAFSEEFKQELESKQLQIIHADVLRWLLQREKKLNTTVPGESEEREESTAETETGAVEDLDLIKFDKVVANLPFNITTDVLKFLLPRYSSIFRTGNENKEGDAPNDDNEVTPATGGGGGDVYLLLQDEAAQRLCECSVGDTNYRAMNVLVDCYCSDREYLFRIDRKAFFPAPNVDGALAHFKIVHHEEALATHDGEGGKVKISTKQFDTFVNQCFSRRRKMLKNNIPTNMYEADVVVQAIEEADGLTLQTRPQDISHSQYLLLLHRLQTLKDQQQQFTSKQD
jgi:16S rRNA A1518/A1519 N6-dimethyltransferase RsmA/KsgA/DIM1 with predicted DNA glycosylase/AP lyase activity